MAASVKAGRSGNQFGGGERSGRSSCRQAGPPITFRLNKQWETPMAAIVGSGEYRYRIVEDWAKLPDGWSFKEVAAVGCDRNDNVYVFGRGEHPMMIFDREGNFLRSWGEGQYPRAHGVHMGPDDSIYLTDDGGHFVRKCSLDGKVLLEIGVPCKTAPS